MKRVKEQQPHTVELEDPMNQTEYVSHAICKSDGCRFLDTFNRWFVTDDREQIFSVLTDDIQWEMVGEVRYVGIEAVKQSFDAIPEHSDNAMKRLVVERIYADSQGGVSEGYMTMRDGSEYRFADVVTFDDANERKIRSLQAYLIPIQSQPSDEATT